MNYQVGEVVEFGGSDYRIVQCSERAKDKSKKVVLQEVVEEPLPKA